MYLDFDLFKTISIIIENNVNHQNIHLSIITLYLNKKLHFKYKNLKV